MIEPVRFVAEVSSNHHRDLQRCLAFVDCAAEIGCDAVKFQLFRVRQLFAPEILERSAAHRAREAWELPIAFLAPIAERARARGLTLACTPFDLAAVEALGPHVDFYKVSSYELLWTPLLEACARSGKPVVLSTGMATRSEVAAALDALCGAGARDVTLLHCVSGYPTPPGEANLAAIGTLRALGHDRPDLVLRVGWSDHSVAPGVIHRAIHAHAASMIEFHLDLDGQGSEFEAGHCWLPDAMAAVIADTRLASRCDGSGEKAPAPCERADRDWRADPFDGLRPLRAIRRGQAA
jgi:N-acetylneuraminate synthase